MSAASSTPACDYCGLPMARAPAAGERGYCCFGCRLAADVTQARGDEGAAHWLLARLGLALFLSMNVMVFTMALWTHDFYGDAAPGATAVILHGLFRYLSLLFALPVLFLLGGPLLANAWEGLRRGVYSTDLLLVLGVLAAFLYSAVSVVRDEGRIYFEVGCAVLVLVTLGRWLEATGKLRASTALDALVRLLPAQARVVRADGSEEERPLAAVAAGDCLRVLAGERIPCDGRIETHAALVDERILTGESAPAEKSPGDVVYGGTLNLDGDLYLRVSAAADAGVLARLVALVRAARLTKGPWERLVDRVSAVFLPAVIVIALVAGGVQGWTAGIDHGILAALAVLLIACPCALGLATPMAVWAGLARAAQAGVLFRNGEALERLAAVRAVRFDKTGTLTTAQPAVEHCTTTEPAGPVLALALHLTAASAHCYSAAIRQFLASRNGGDEPLERQDRVLTVVQTLPGLGLFANIDGGAWLGSPRLMQRQGLSWPDSIAAARDRALAAGQPTVCLGHAGAVQALFAFREELRPGTASALAALRDRGLDVAVLTGDGAARAARLGHELGVAVQAELLPEDKVAAVRAARQRFGSVAMVGDGINDAPALGAADVGIALGCGADVARDAAGVCLIGDDPRQVPWAIDLAARTVRAIRQNLFWAFIYNVGGIGLAAAGWLNPVLAAFAMTISSLFVVTNSLRLHHGLAPDAPPADAARDRAAADLPLPAETAP